jgi:LPXTG-motif cell wall-anchored protein
VTPAGVEETFVPPPPAAAEPTLVGELAPPAIPVIEPPIEPRQDLPKTASNVVAVSLAGIALIVGAALLKARRTTVM